MKRRILPAAVAAAFVAVVGIANPANADTVSLPYGGTATLTIPDVTMSADQGCIEHYGTFSTTHIDYWNVDINVTGPSTWPPSDYLFGTGPSSQIVALTLCPSMDGPGTYTATGLVTVEDPYSWDQLNALVTDTYTISRPTPPPPPPPPPAPAPTYADVTGKVTNKPVARGVKFTFKSNALPSGATLRNTLKWKVVADGRTKASFSQGPSNIRTKTVRFAARSGKHVVKVLRNGRVVKTVRFRA